MATDTTACVQKISYDFNRNLSIKKDLKLLFCLMLDLFRLRILQELQEGIMLHFKILTSGMSMSFLEAMT